MFDIVLAPRQRMVLPWMLATLIASTFAPEGLAQSPPARPAAAALVTTDDVQAAITQLEQATDLSADSKTQAQELYKEALEELRIADDWSDKAETFKSERQAAPKQLEDVKQQLNQPPAERPAEVAAGATLDQLKLTQTQAEQARGNLQTELNDLEAAVRRRGDRFEEVRVLDGAAKHRLESLDKQLGESTADDKLDPLERANRVLLLAKKSKTLAERACYAEELPTYEATRELMRARLDLATRQLNQAEQAEAKWRTVVADRSRQDAEIKAYDARWAVMTARPEVLPLAEENERLAELRSSADGPSAKLKKVQEDVAELTAQHNRLQAQAAHVKKIADLTDSIGLLLQKQRADLPDMRKHRKNIAARQTEIANIKLEMFELEASRSDLADIDPEVQRIVAGMSLPAGSPDRANLEHAVRDLLETRRDYLDALIADYNNYFNALVMELDKSERELIRETEDYANYIAERIFWIRSSPPLGHGELARTWRAGQWLADPAKWTAVGTTLWKDVREHSVLDGLCGAVLLLLLFSQRRVRRRVQEIGRQVAGSYTDRIFPTVEAGLWTVVLAALWPLVMWLLAWRLMAAGEDNTFVKGVAFALHVMAVACLTTELFRQVCRRNGLAELHFRWPEASLVPLRSNLRWVLALGLPITFLVALIEQQDGSTHDASLGRLVFIVGLIFLTWFAQRLLPPIYQVIKNQAGQDRVTWLERTHACWYPVVMSVPLALAVIASLGYYYAALQLTWRLQASVWLVLGLLVAHSFLLRWVLVARRSLAIRHARQLRVSQANHEPDPTGGLDLSTIDVQNRRLLRSAFLLTLVIGCWLVWVDVLPALKVLDEWRLWSYHDAVAQTSADGKVAPAVMQMHWVTVGDLGLSVLVVLMTIIGSRNLPGLLEIAWLQRLPLDAGGRYALTSLCRYVITVVGIAAAARTIGIGWSNVQWLAAAMTVGLGFGLQEIFANFVSGLIILFERPVRVGDTVTICGVTGTVNRIRSRATTILDGDRKELIVPNKEFITGQVVNWTLTDSISRLSIKVAIAHGTDVTRATQLLLETAQNHPKVMHDPAPGASLVDFGGGSLQLEMHCYLASLDQRSAARHELILAIDEAFRKAGIELSFPQQEIVVRGLPEVFSLTELRGPRTVGKIGDEHAKSA